MSDTPAVEEPKLILADQVQELIKDTSWVDSLYPVAVNLGIAIAIYIIGFWIAGKIVRVLGKMMRMRHVDQALSDFLQSIASIVLKIVVLLAVLEQLGVDTTSLLAILGAAGLAVGLALKDSLSNFAAGIMLIVFKPFKIGDFVEAGDIAGVVERISVFSTLIHSVDNKEIIIPNAQVYGGTIINYSAKPTRRIDMVFGIGYGDDMKKARQLIVDVISADERILKDPETVVAVHELAESSVNIVVRPWVKSDDYWAVRWDLIEKIKERFDANGISIPFPQRDVHIHQKGN